MEVIMLKKAIGFILAFGFLTSQVSIVAESSENLIQQIQKKKVEAKACINSFVQELKAMDPKEAVQKLNTLLDQGKISQKEACQIREQLRFSLLRAELKKVLPQEALKNIKNLFDQGIISQNEAKLLLQEVKANIQKTHNNNPIHSDATQNFKQKKTHGLIEFFKLGLMGTLGLQMLDGLVGLADIFAGGNIIAEQRSVLLQGVNDIWCDENISSLKRYGKIGLWLWTKLSKQVVPSLMPIAMNGLKVVSISEGLPA